MDSSENQTTVESLPSAELKEDCLCPANEPLLLSRPDARELANEFTAGGGQGPEPHIKSAALKAYSGQLSQLRQDNLITEYLPLVHRIVQQVVSYLRPPLSREDLVSAGTVGLVRAARDYDGSRNAEFKTYAYIRIKGAVIDELREWSFTPSGIKKQFNSTKEIFRKMTEELGREPNDEELAKRLGISAERMYHIFEVARTRQFLSIHERDDDDMPLGLALAAPDTQGPSAGLEQTELLERLTHAISNLPAKLRKIIILYYTKELNMKQVAEVMGITESRVSQLHASALFKLSVRMKEEDENV